MLINSSKAKTSHPHPSSTRRHEPYSPKISPPSTPVVNKAQVKGKISGGTQIR
ncbi:MAG: hypothetical protein AB8B68_00965 [Rickettsiaceae bacterium]